MHLATINHHCRGRVVGARRVRLRAQAGELVCRARTRPFALPHVRLGRGGRAINRRSAARRQCDLPPFGASPRRRRADDARL